MDNITKNWFTAIKPRGEDLFNLDGLSPLPQPDGIYYADPFIHNGYLFVEQFDRVKGVIACCSLNNLSKMKVVLEREYHLSFPHVFEWDNEIYMMPESAGGAAVEIYKAVKFPYEWKLFSRFLEGHATADPVTFPYENDLYVFLTKHEDNNLEVFKTRDLRGFELIHRQQILHSRNAGNPFLYKDKILRPTQNSEGIYGRAIEIKEITLPDYTEKPYKSIEPVWYPGLIGTHTFNFDDRHIVIDGKYEKTLDPH